MRVGCNGTRQAHIFYARQEMDSILGKTLSAVSHALGLGMMETSLLLGAVLLFTIYKIIDLS